MATIVRGPLALAAGASRVNDIHSKLNDTLVDAVVPVTSDDDVRAAIYFARARGRAVSVAGGRHAMGGQQFGADAVLIDMTTMDRVVALDADRGLITVEAGIQWPALVDFLVISQADRRRHWGIVQKQTGADRLSIGGALAANIHGRGLRLRPFVNDVEAFDLIDADGVLRHCSRRENPALFRLAIGGYGLFGIVTRVTLRLAWRRKVERRVRLETGDRLIDAFDARIAEGFEYGDFQFAIDPCSGDFLHRGVLSCYRPVPDDTPMPSDQRVFTNDHWRLLSHLAHRDKTQAFELYVRHYLETDGQLYWSDTHQLSLYLEDYHVALDHECGVSHPGSEMISEICVPRATLATFLEDARRDLRRRQANLIYGTVRLVERDEETMLAWAAESWACVIFNLHVDHTTEGVGAAAVAFRSLIDLGLAHGGSYYLTYHRWARRDQVEACYPQLCRFLSLKRRHDPEEVFQSDWYRHYVRMFSQEVLR
jgi:FAD/FMN-containing dehydrogenase